MDATYLTSMSYQPPPGSVPGIVHMPPSPVASAALNYGAFSGDFGLSGSAEMMAAVAPVSSVAVRAIGAPEVLPLPGGRYMEMIGGAGNVL